MPPKPVARPKKDFSVSYPKIQAELATMQAKLTASQEEVAALRVELKKDTAARERAAIEETARLHELLELRNRDVDLLRGSMLRMRETFASLSAGLRTADEESSVALGALGLLEARVGGAGGSDVALATLRAELARCEWELSDSKVGIGQAEESWRWRRCAWSCAPSRRSSRRRPRCSRRRPRRRPRGRRRPVGRSRPR